MEWMCRRCLKRARSGNYKLTLTIKDRNGETEIYLCIDCTELFSDFIYADSPDTRPTPAPPPRPSDDPEAV